ncbi:DUF2169 domain-containing protein [Motiliproteus sp. MSK22-1]|uniref:DUF2169 family type VI secretion system accessory protein n=1 Tax=Motiliproteus sp. MSK22-1 TaxID=1897630 RepID=UPI0009787ACD|nr:DUF2169 domain-containing protein [Motiliproteus sp. MSK22-1]OMH25757.1 hypothetical protein BGP75_24835 [Motiliproteus sp. MSK22-1]
MKVENHTPFPSVAWENADASRCQHLTCLTRVKYRLQPPPDYYSSYWSLRLTPDQGELFGGDQYYGDDITRPVRYESDFITYKSRTDIVLNAIAHSPDGTPKMHWNCGIKVLTPSGKILKHLILNVRGARQWVKMPIGWAKSPLEAVKRVRLSYDKAQGGSLYDPRKEEEEIPTYLAYNAINPSGTGIRHRKMLPNSFPVHQVEWATPQLTPKSYPPGFGFINRAWPIRTGYAGTYDQQWLDNQHPYPPKDFNVFHHQAANPELILDRHIEVNSRFELENLLPRAPRVSFHLPELHCFVETTDKQGNQSRTRMKIDTVLIDIESDQSEDWAVYVSYRHYQVINDPIQALNFKYLPVEWINRSKTKPPRTEQSQTEQSQKAALQEISYGR